MANDGLNITNKKNLIFRIVQAVISYLSKINCKTTSCCGSKCSSECNTQHKEELPNDELSNDDELPPTP